MKILGSEDYYDYFANIYGVDPLVILDRRGGHKISPPETTIQGQMSRIDDARLIHLHFCGTRYFGLQFPSGKVYWGDEIKELGDYVPSKKTWDGKFTAPYVRFSPQHSCWFKSTNTKMNDELDCPILYRISYLSQGHPAVCGKIDHGYIKFPNRLKDIEFPRVVDAETAYKTIYSWLLNRRQDGEHDVLDNKEKIVAKGFDTKKSFRHRT